MGDRGILRSLGRFSLSSDHEKQGRVNPIRPILQVTTKTRNTGQASPKSQFSEDLPSSSLRLPPEKLWNKDPHPLPTEIPTNSAASHPSATSSRPRCYFLFPRNSARLSAGFPEPRRSPRIANSLESVSPCAASSRLLVSQLSATEAFAHSKAASCSASGRCFRDTNRKDESDNVK